MKWLLLLSIIIFCPGCETLSLRPFCIIIAKTVNVGYTTTTTNQTGTPSAQTHIEEKAKESVPEIPSETWEPLK